MARTMNRCALGIALLLYVGAAAAVYFPTPSGFRVVNNDTLNNRVKSGDIIRIIFMDENPDFALVFLDTAGPRSFIPADATFTLSVVIRPFDYEYPWIPIWTAARNAVVQQNAVLAMENSGNLTLRDSDGKLVWSTNTFIPQPNKVGVNMTDVGNLVLLDAANRTAWESFRFPTDVLVPTQTLSPGSSLVSSISSSNRSSGAYTLSAKPGGLALYNASAGGAAYWWKSVIPSNNSLYATEHTCKHPHEGFFGIDEGLVIRALSKRIAQAGVDPSLCSQAEAPGSTVVIAPATAGGAHDISRFQFVRVDPDGVVRLYSYSINSRAWFPVEGAFVPQ